MRTSQIKLVRPDAKGKITLGALAKGISGFTVTQDKDNRIILVPLVEIPAREKWLFNNEVALDQLKQGIKDSANGKLKDRGDFS